MIATVVLGVAAAGVLLPFASSAAVREEGMRRTLAAKLAADLMERIVNTPFEQIVDNFNYTESQGQVKDSTGAVFTSPRYAKFSRTVSCQGDVYVSQESGSAQSKFIRATVSVYYGGRQMAAVSRLITK